MALSPELLSNINAAFGRFLDLCPDFFNDDKGQNKGVLCRQLRAMHVPTTDWISEHVFSAAFVAGKAAGIFITPPTPKTREQREHERNVRDRAAGRQRYRKDEDAKPQTFTDIKSPIDAINDLLTGKKHA